MNLLNRTPVQNTGTEWVDIVEDFLEVRCRLNDSSRSYLLQALRRIPVAVNEIDTPSSFRIGRHLIVLTEDGQTPEECWLFSPPNKLKKVKLR